nr:glycosyltransferase [Actinomycetota bacterium]
VQRNAKLARYLPRLGWEVDVVTGPGSPDYSWAPIDETMQDDASPAVRVHRLPSPEPGFSTGWRDRAERWLFLQSRWQRWWEEAVSSCALDVGRNADLVYASIAPYTTARAALRTARLLRKPLVIDLEDPWALDEMMIYPTGLHRRVELRRMRNALASADGVVMNTPEAEARVRARFPEVAPGYVTAIPNGYDAADFAGPVPPPSEIVRIVHAGSLHTDFALRHRRLRPLRRLLGGAEPGLELLTRSHVFVLEAIRALLRERPELVSRIELHLVGALSDADRAALGDAPFVIEHGFVSHGRAVELMRSASLLFLPMHDLPEGRRVAIVPCKAYEYLAARRPILAAVPDGDARDLLSEAGNAYLCRPADVGAMKDAIADTIARSESGIEAPAPNSSLLERLERGRLTADLASFLERVIGGNAAALSCAASSTAHTTSATAGHTTLFADGRAF